MLPHVRTRNRPLGHLDFQSQSRIGITRKDISRSIQIQQVKNLRSFSGKQTNGFSPQGSIKPNLDAAARQHLMIPSSTVMFSYLKLDIHLPGRTMKLRNQTRTFK